MEIIVPALPRKHSLTERIFGALRLRTEIYDEVKRDTEATWQGAVLVLSAWLCFVWPGLHNPYRLLFSLVVLGSWPLVTVWFLISAKYLFARSTTWDMANGLLRTMALSYAPRLIYFFQLFVPWSLWWPVIFAIYLWQVVMTIVALRHGLQISTGRAIWVWFGTVALTGLLLIAGAIALRLGLNVIG